MAAKKQALGRGLGALIDDASKEKIEKADLVNEIKLSEIETNPYQPRVNFDEEGLSELAASIRELGIIQPITVRQMPGGKYQLIAGERRLRASREAGLSTIPAFIRVAEDQEMLELALVENIQREDLDAIEVAISYQRLIEECQLTQEAMSDRVGKKRATISNYLRLLKLPAEIQLGIRDRKISMGHARALVNVEDPKLQMKAFYSIIEDDLSVRKVEELVRGLGKDDSSSLEKKERKQQIQQEYRDLEDKLSSFFTTGVKFRMNPEGKGKIVIPFDNGDELQKILGILDNNRD